MLSPHRLDFGYYILLLTVLFLFWVKHFPPAKYEEAILYPASREAVSERGREQRVAGAAANVQPPDRHVSVDVVHVSEHDLS